MGEGEICMQELDGRGRRDWVMEIERQVNNNETLKTEETGAWRKHTIYKIPEGFISDDKRKQAYQPQVVSMGPYHHGEKQLQPMEEHKLRALRHFLVRTNRGVREYRDALRGVVQELMDSYKDLGNEWKDDEERFLQLMIFDGCFMIELLRTDGSLTLEGYDENDPIFSGHGMLSNMPRIKRDMLMIENQIPLLVLKKILSVAQGVDDDQDEKKQWSLNQEVNNMVLVFFGVEEKGTEPMPPKRPSLHRWRTKNNSITTTPSTKNSDPTNTRKSTTEPPSSTSTVMSKLESAEKVELGLHALDLVRNSMIKDTKGRRRDVTAPSNDVIWPATQLQEAGIKFTKSDGSSLKDIDFSTRYGLCATLSLPQLVVDDATESKFLNIIAFEHLHVSSGNEVSSYVCFMDNIIDSEKDVSLLSQNDIIKNFVGTDQAVADLFNGISHDVSIDPVSDLSAVHKKVTEYCNDPCNKNCANLKHGYFSTPWSVIASVAAGVALLITIIQFVYSILSYYLHDG